jgi:hypothetical protein
VIYNRLQQGRKSTKELRPAAYKENKTGEIDRKINIIRGFSVK